MGSWIADRFLLPLALASGWLLIHTCEVTEHLLTNAAVVHRFPLIRIDIAGVEGSTVLVPPVKTIVPYYWSFITIAVMPQYANSDDEVHRHEETQQYCPTLAVQ